MDVSLKDRIQAKIAGQEKTKLEPTEPIKQELEVNISVLTFLIFFPCH